MEVVMRCVLVTIIYMLVVGFAQQEPALFSPGVLSSPDEEFRITFTPDGNTAYFGLSPSGAWFPSSRRATIMVSQFENGTWTAPEVAPFSGEYSDIDPFVSPDGSRLFFSSIRPVNGAERRDVDLWMVERQGEGWGEPVHLGDAVNSPQDDLYPSVSEDGTLYFASERELATSGWNIYRSSPDDSGNYSAAQKLPETVNTAAWEFNPAISRDGRTLLFTGLRRQDGFGLGDIYISHHEDGAWTEAENLGEGINTAADEFHPSLSPDETTLYFIRRLGGNGDIYSVDLALP